MPQSIARVRRMFATPKPNADLLAPVTQQLRAWPWLCDFQGHINNARYLDLMSSGRLEWLLQNRLLRAVVTRRMAFLIAGLGGLYRHSIPRLAPFVLQTRVAAFDERWLYYEHTFRLGEDPQGTVAARFLARGQLRARGRSLGPRESLRLCGVELPERALTPPADLDAWNDAQGACLEVIRAQ